MVGTVQKPSHERLQPGHASSFRNVQLILSHTPWHFITIHLKLVSTACFAKHVNDKGAKKAAAKRPKKHRLSDINRKPIVYELHNMKKPAEYTIEEN